MWDIASGDRRSPASYGRRHSASAGAANIVVHVSASTLGRDCGRGFLCDEGVDLTWVGLKMLIDDRTEWLEADGLGGFASGTTSGVRTRRYHALLLSALTPPTGRVVLVNGFDAWVDTSGGSFALSTQRYAPDVLHPDGAS